MGKVLISLYIFKFDKINMVHSGSDFLSAWYYALVLMPGPIKENLSPAKHGTSSCVFLVSVHDKFHTL
jgi:hypothetical protein